MAEIRLQKAIAQAGLASRREAERLIEEGRVAVNGRVVKRLGTLVDPQKDAIEVDGKQLSDRRSAVYLIFYKPQGVLTTARDDRGRQTVFDLLDEVLGERLRALGRVFTVGRLDYHSEGLLIVTNDGALAELLTHPRNRVPRTYSVRVRGAPGEAAMARLAAGLLLEDGPAQALEANILKRNERSTWIEITVAEGRNRLVRRMCEALGLEVQRLVRVEHGGVTLGDLRPGEVRDITDNELEKLQGWGDLALEGEPAAAPRPPRVLAAASRERPDESPRRARAAPQGPVGGRVGRRAEGARSKERRQGLPDPQPKGRGRVDRSPHRRRPGPR